MLSTPMISQGAEAQSCSKNERILWLHTISQGLCLCPLQLKPQPLLCSQNVQFLSKMGMSVGLPTRQCHSYFIHVSKMFSTNLAQ